MKKYRNLRRKHFDLIFKNDSAVKEIEELETKDAVQNATVKAREFITSEEFLSQKFDTKEIEVYLQTENYIAVKSIRNG